MSDEVDSFGHLVGGWKNVWTKPVNHRIVNVHALRGPGQFTLAENSCFISDVSTCAKIQSQQVTRLISGDFCLESLFVTFSFVCMLVSLVSHLQLNTELTRNSQHVERLSDVQTRTTITMVAERC